MWLDIGHEDYLGYRVLDFFFGLLSGVIFLPENQTSISLVPSRP